MSAKQIFQPMMQSILHEEIPIPGCINTPTHAVKELIRVGYNIIINTTREQFLARKVRQKP